MVNEPLTVDGKVYHVTLVNVGNPHCVVFVDDVSTLDLPALGPKFENHPLFFRSASTPSSSRSWTVTTSACGYGSAVAARPSPAEPAPPHPPWRAILNGLTYDTVMVHLLGGDLIIEWRNHEDLYMTGGAQTVFTGEWK